MHSCLTACHSNARGAIFQTNAIPRFDLSNAQRKQQTHIFIHLVYVKVFSRSSSCVSACTNLELYVAAETTTTKTTTTTDTGNEQKAQTESETHSPTAVQTVARRIQSFLAIHQYNCVRNRAFVCSCFFPSSRSRLALMCARNGHSADTGSCMGNSFSRYSTPNPIE